MAHNVRRYTSGAGTVAHNVRRYTSGAGTVAHDVRRYSCRAGTVAHNVRRYYDQWPPLRAGASGVRRGAGDGTALAIRIPRPHFPCFQMAI